MIMIYKCLALLYNILLVKIENIYSDMHKFYVIVFYEIFVWLGLLILSSIIKEFSLDLNVFTWL
jgi:hypothetical protein